MTAKRLASGKHACPINIVVRVWFLRVSAHVVQAQGEGVVGAEDVCEHYLAVDRFTDAVDFAVRLAERHGGEQGGPQEGRRGEPPNLRRRVELLRVSLDGEGWECVCVWGGLIPSFG